MMAQTITHAKTLSSAGRAKPKLNFGKSGKLSRKAINGALSEHILLALGGIFIFWTHWENCENAQFFKIPTDGDKKSYEILNSRDFYL